MKVKSMIFVLFLVVANLTTTLSQAKSASSQPQQEIQAAQEAYQLGQDTQQRETDFDTAYKNEHCSADALHWSFVSTNQANQLPLLIDQSQGADRKGAAATTAHRNANDKPSQVAQ
jgi:hypothetical protein